MPKKRTQVHLFNLQQYTYHVAAGLLAEGRRFGFVPTPEIAFIIRRTPEQSAYPGIIAVEMQVLRGVNLKQSLLLAGVDIELLDPFEKVYYERYVGYRFHVREFKPALLMELHDLCRPSNIPELVKETERRLLKLSKVPAEQAMADLLSKDDLVALAMRCHLGDVRNMTKLQLATAIYAAAVKAYKQPAKTLVAA